jgi:hypothetical protein
MDREEVKQVVRLMLRVVGRIAKRTRSPADDLLTSILQTNESRLAEVVFALAARGDQAVTDEEVTKALEQVGIKV